MKILFLVLSLALIFTKPEASHATLQCAGLFSGGYVDYSRRPPEGTSAVYGTADETFARKFELLRGARHSILISTFSIKPDAWYARDSIGRTLADILIEKHTQGLEVKVFTDYWGNPPSTRAEIHRMLASGVDVRYFGAPSGFFQLLVKAFRALRRLNIENLNHGKTLVVDGWDSMTGGYNWMSGQTKGIKSWRDTDFYIAGSIAKDVSQGFYSIFETLPKLTSEPEMPRSFYIYPASRSGLDEFKMQAPWLDSGRQPINDKILSLIEDANPGDAIFWQSFAFRTQPVQLEALRRAAARGVKITILTNSMENLYKQLFSSFYLPLAA